MQRETEREREIPWLTLQSNLLQTPLSCECKNTQHVVCIQPSTGMRLQQCKFPQTLLHQNSGNVWKCITWWITMTFGTYPLGLWLVQSETTLSMACLQMLSAVDRLWCGFGLIHQNDPAEVSWIAMRCGLWVHDGWSCSCYCGSCCGCFGSCCCGCFCCGCGRCWCSWSCSCCAFAMFLPVPADRRRCPHIAIHVSFGLGGIFQMTK